jgi:hypothetical protein
MGNSSAPMIPLCASDGCPLVPYERQSVQHAILDSLNHHQPSSSTASLLPIVLIDIIIDYSGLVTGMHIITLDKMMAGQFTSLFTIGWISSSLPPRHGTLSTDAAITVDGRQRHHDHKSNDGVTSLSTMITDDILGWRLIYGTFPPRTHPQHVQHINGIIYIIGYRKDIHGGPKSNVMMRCHVADLFTSAFSDAIPSSGHQCESLITWHNSEVTIFDEVRTDRVRMTTCVWQGTRILVVRYYGGSARPDVYYYDTVTSIWHVIPNIVMSSSDDIRVSVHENHYLFLYNTNGDIALYNEEFNKWMILNDIRKHLQKHLRLIVSAPSWLSPQHPVSSLINSTKSNRTVITTTQSNNTPTTATTSTSSSLMPTSTAGTANATTKLKISMAIGTISHASMERDASHQLLYHCIDIHGDGTCTSTLITTSISNRSTFRRNSGDNRSNDTSGSGNDYQKKWKIPDWCYSWPIQPFYCINDRWLLLRHLNGDSPCAVVCIDDIPKRKSWKWYEPGDKIIKAATHLTLFYPFSSSHHQNHHIWGTSDFIFTPNN